METFSAFEYAVASTAEIIKETAPDQAGLPTPCAEWDVRALLSHVIGTLWLTEALFTGQAPRYPMVPGGLPGAGPDGRVPGGDDPAAAYAEAAAAALAAVGAGDALCRAHVTPLGEMPGPLLAGFTTLDIAVHGWDLARATGQPADLDGRSPSRRWPRPKCEVRASARPVRSRAAPPSRSGWPPSSAASLNRLRP